MKLTIEQVSKLTKVSIPTLRVYVSRQKLGTKVGNNRFFSQADVQKLLKGTKKAAAKETKPAAKAPAKKAKPAKQAKASSRPKASAAKPAASKPAAAKPAPVKAPAQKTAAPRTDKPELKVKPARPSFWSRLFGSRGPKQKINVLEAKTTK